MRDRELAEQEHSLQVHVQHQVPLGLAVLVQRLVHEGPGVVHQDVQPPERFHGGLDAALGVGRARDIRVGKQRAPGAVLAGLRTAGLVLNVSDRDPRAGRWRDYDSRRGQHHLRADQRRVLNEQRRRRAAANARDSSLRERMTEWPRWVGDRVGGCNPVTMVHWAARSA